MSVNFMGVARFELSSCCSLRQCVIVISKFLKRHLIAMCRAPAYSCNPLLLRPPYEDFHVQWFRRPTRFVPPIAPKLSHLLVHCSLWMLLLKNQLDYAF